ncbi:hypothetical protein EJ074_16445 [Mesorhizobium sp. M3A.F.Ca.ET.080.04.2.1]|uniref:hypothetical protein n=1 Tax=Mesorhizobium sp. M3A.F.Ca.ET.080.04.2.1 TaxID=2493676 RepID=UPI000F754988|nr:hypothetical protein [Mesorhizobium sp. M3A.F.Ca.ET.080.04.2.1]AZO10544.1 hypothetical protein EJ074_16445 [Mesorhizobium sp. M3A.F.Ca.ET.080.04.2.1]RWF23451.1 MAG: hypothetical protein EOS64_11345 [Mesorhizobium sp.]
MSEVSVREVVGEWRVSVRAGGHSPWMRVFDSEASANAFAQAQRARLGLAATPLLEKELAGAEEL